MIQKMKKKTYSGTYANLDKQLDELSTHINHCRQNYIIIYDWKYRKHRKFWTGEVRTKRSQNITIKTTSAISGSTGVANQIWKGLDSWTDLPSNRRRLAKYLNNLLKQAKLDKYWVILY
jgi:hypothetical protein